MISHKVAASDYLMNNHRFLFFQQDNSSLVLWLDNSEFLFQTQQNRFFMNFVNVLYSFAGDPSDPTQLNVNEGDRLVLKLECGDGWSEVSLTDYSLSGVVPTSYLSASFQDSLVQQSAPIYQQPTDIYNYSYQEDNLYQQNAYRDTSASQNNMYQQHQFVSSTQQQFVTGAQQQFISPVQPQFIPSVQQQFISPVQQQYIEPGQQQYSPPDQVQLNPPCDAYEKFNKMIKSGIPEGAVQQAATRDGVSLPPDFFSQLSSTTEAASADASSPSVDIQFEKYRKMIKAGLPEPAVRQAATRDGVSLPPDFFSQPSSTSEAASSPSVDIRFEKYSRMIKAGLPEPAVRQAATRDGVPLPPDFFSQPSSTTEAASAGASAPSVDIQFEKYSKMIKAGLPEPAVRQAASRDGVNLPGNFFSLDHQTASLGSASPPHSPPPNPLLAGIQGFNKQNLSHSEKSEETEGATNPLLVGIAGFDKSKMKKSNSKSPPAPVASNPSDMMSIIAAKAKARQARQQQTMHEPEPVKEGHKPEWVVKREHQTDMVPAASEKPARATTKQEFTQSRAVQETLITESPEVASLSPPPSFSPSQSPMVSAPSNDMSQPSRRGPPSRTAPVSQLQDPPIPSQSTTQPSSSQLQDPSASHSPALTAPQRKPPPARAAPNRAPPPGPPSRAPPARSAPQRAPPTKSPPVRAAPVRQAPIRN